MIHLCDDAGGRPVGVGAVVYPLPTSLPRAEAARRVATGVALRSFCVPLLTLAAACGQPGAEPRDSPTAIVIGLPSSQADVRPLVRTLTTLQLIGTGPDGRPTPGLLQSWTLSPDGRTWEFTLLPDVRRHDGAPVTADDVAVLIRDQVAEDPLAGLTDILRVDAVDPARLRIHLREPSNLLLEALTLTRAVPAGAFVPGSEEIELTSSPTLAANRTPGRGPTSVDHVVFRRYETPRAAWSALMRGEIDLLHEVSGDARPFLEQSSGIEVRPFLRPFVITLGLNVRHAALRHQDVRRALNHGVDRQELISEDFGGHGLAAATHVWPRHWAADASVLPHAFVPALARRLLDGAGFRPVKGADGRVSRMRLTCLVLQDVPRLERVALRVRRAYSAIGVELEFDVVDQDTLVERLAAGRFEMFLLPVMAGYGPNVLYHTWGGNSPARFFDHGYEAAAPAAEALRRAHTDEQVRTSLQALQHVLYDVPPAVFLVWEETARAVGRRFVVPPSPGRDILATLAHWRPQSPPEGDVP